MKTSFLFLLLIICLLAVSESTAAAVVWKTDGGWSGGRHHRGGLSLLSDGAVLLQTNASLYRFEPGSPVPVETVDLPETRISSNWPPPAISADGEIVAVQVEKDLLILDADLGELSRLSHAGIGINGFVLAEDGTRLYVALGDSLQAHSVPDLEPLWSRECVYPRGLAYADDPNVLVMGCRIGAADVTMLVSGSDGDVHWVSEPTNRMGAHSISSDGKWIVSASERVYAPPNPAPIMTSDWPVRPMDSPPGVFQIRPPEGADSWDEARAVGASELAWYRFTPAGILTAAGTTPIGGVMLAGADVAGRPEVMVTYNNATNVAHYVHVHTDGRILGEESIDLPVAEPVAGKGGGYMVIDSGVGTSEFALFAAGHENRQPTVPDPPCSWSRRGDTVTARFLASDPEGAELRTEWNLTPVSESGRTPPAHMDFADVVGAELQVDVDSLKWVLVRAFDDKGGWVHASCTPPDEIRSDDATGTPGPSTVLVVVAFLLILVKRSGRRRGRPAFGQKP